MTYLQKIIFGIFLFFSCVLIAQQHGVEGGNITWEFKQENNVGYIRFYLKVDNEDGSYGDMSGLQPVLTNLRTRVRGSGYNVTQDGSFGEKTFYFYPVQKQYLDIMANEADPNFILKKESIYRRAERGSADINSFKGKESTDVNTNPMGWDKEGVRNVLKGPDGYKIPPQLKTSYYQTLWLEVDPRQWDYASYIDVAVTMRTRGLDRLPLPPTEDHPYGSFYRYRSPGERFTSSLLMSFGALEAEIIKPNTILVILLYLEQEYTLIMTKTGIRFLLIKLKISLQYHLIWDIKEYFRMDKVA